MPSKSNLIFAIVVVVALGGLAAAYINVIGGGGADATATATANPEDAEMVARGKAKYGENCADCHGKNLEGQPNWRVKTAAGVYPAPPHDATGHTWHHADQVLFKIIKRGGQAGAPTGYTSGMPSFAENLTDEDILDVLAFIKSRWPQEIRKRQARMNSKMAGQ